MNRNHPPDEHAKFQSNVRHYHRSVAPSLRSWEDWVEGAAGKPRRKKRQWWKVMIVVIGLLALGGIVTGLLVELL